MAKPFKKSLKTSWEIWFLPVVINHLKILPQIPKGNVIILAVRRVFFLSEKDYGLLSEGQQINL